MRLCGMCQFLIGKVQPNRIYEWIFRRYGLCQFLIGKVQRFFEKQRIHCRRFILCQFLIGKVQHLRNVIKGVVVGAMTCVNSS